MLQHTNENTIFFQTIESWRYRSCSRVISTPYFGCCTGSDFIKVRRSSGSVRKYWKGINKQVVRLRQLRLRTLLVSFRFVMLFPFPPFATFNFLCICCPFDSWQGSSCRQIGSTATWCCSGAHFLLVTMPGIKKILLLLKGKKGSGRATDQLGWRRAALMLEKYPFL